MAPRSYTISTPTNPIMQILYFLLGGVLLIGAVLMGAVILAIALGLGLMVGLVVYVRVWWLKRKLGRKAGAASEPGSARKRDVLEVEYTVVEERDDERG